MASLLQPIDRKSYPELDLILWDRAETFIPAADAFSAYEKRWRYVNQENLIPAERILIDELTRVLGNGLFLAA